MARRMDARTAGRIGPTAAKKVKRTIVLTPEASRRLDVHAVGLGLDVSAVVERLILDQLRRFQLHDRDRDRPTDLAGGPAAPAA